VGTDRPSSSYVSGTSKRKATARRPAQKQVTQEVNGVGEVHPAVGVEVERGPVSRVLEAAFAAGERRAAAEEEEPQDGDGIAHRQPRVAVEVAGEDPAQRMLLLPFIDARRAEAHRLVDVGIDHEAHADRAGLPAACDQPAERAGARLFGINMEGLGIVLPAEGDDLLLAEGMAPELGALAELEVLPVLHVCGATRSYFRTRSRTSSGSATAFIDGSALT